MTKSMKDELLEKATFDFLATAAAALPTEKLELDELGVTVVVRGLTQGQMAEFVKRATKKPAKGKGEPEVDENLLNDLLFGVSLYTEDGQRLIPEGREAELRNISAQLWQKLNRAIVSINGMGGADLEKNSAVTAGDVSPSA